MGYYVSSLAMLQSAKCPHAFACLKTGKCASPSRCEAAEIDDTMVLLKNSEPLERCPYRLGIGARQFCTCPTFVALCQQKQFMNDKPYQGKPRSKRYDNEGEYYEK
jgi:hypothetical protein